MSVAAEPRPADLPLPGGRPGATVRLHPLLAGELRLPAAFLAREGTGRLAAARALGIGPGRIERIWVPVPFYLVRHPGAGAVLVDTGFHPSVAVDPKESMGRIGNRLCEFRVTPEQAPHRLVRDLGVERAGVGVVLMTHLHLDHASGVEEFPEATFLLDRREWEAATGPRPFLRGYRPRQFDHAFDWRTIDYDDPSVDAFATFGRSVDVFGDGSVRLLSTPGHSAGHQSVLLRLGGGEALLTGDAAYLRRTIEDDVMPARADDEHRFRRSLREIRRFAAQTPGLLVIPGHDPDAWAALAPEYR